MKKDGRDTWGNLEAAEAKEAVPLLDTILELLKKMRDSFTQMLDGGEQRVRLFVFLWAGVLLPVFTSFLSLTKWESTSWT